MHHASIGHLKQSVNVTEATMEMDMNVMVKTI